MKVEFSSVDDTQYTNSVFVKRQRKKHCFKTNVLTTLTILSQVCIRCIKYHNLSFKQKTFRATIKKSEGILFVRKCIKTYGFNVCLLSHCFLSFYNPYLLFTNVLQIQQKTLWNSMELIHKTMLIALGIAHWIFLPPTVIAPKYLYLKCEKKSVQVNSYDE